MKNKIAIFSLVAISTLVLAACTKQTAVNNTSSGASDSNNAQSSPSTQDETGAVVVTYNNGTFSPNPANAKVGQKVIFKNVGTNPVQVNSDPHPTHTLYPELNLDLISPGESKSTTFAKAGTYTYHNHAHASEKGTITVE